jgi:hypothetical protein
VQTLLEFAPPQLRLVIVSRTVPPMSLSRLRDQGALQEICPRELRFTLDEVQGLPADPAAAQRRPDGCQAAAFNASGRRLRRRKVVDAIGQVASDDAGR